MGMTYGYTSELLGILVKIRGALRWNLRRWELEVYHRRSWCIPVRSSVSWWGSWGISVSCGRRRRSVMGNPGPLFTYQLWYCWQTGFVPRQGKPKRGKYSAPYTCCLKHYILQCMGLTDLQNCPSREQCQIVLTIWGFFCWFQGGNLLCLHISLI